MRKLMLLTLLFATPAVLAASHGEPMPAGDAVAISAVAADPDAHAGKAGKFSGRITEVCQKEGCWVVLESDGASARVAVKDHAFSVPKDATGPAVAYGVLEVQPVSEEQARHLVEDDGAKAPAARELRIVATAIEILP